MESIKVELRKVTLAEVEKKCRYISERVSQLESKESRNHYERWLLESYKEDLAELGYFTRRAHNHKYDFIYMIGDVVFQSYEDGNRIWKQFNTKTL